MIENLIQVVRELGLVASFQDLYFGKIKEKFDDQGKLLDQSMLLRIDKFFEELIWLAKTLKYGRDNIPSQYHN